MGELFKTLTNLGKLQYQRCLSLGNFQDLGKLLSILRFGKMPLKVYLSLWVLGSHGWVSLSVSLQKKDHRVLVAHQSVLVCQGWGKRTTTKRSSSCSFGPVSESRSQSAPINNCFPYEHTTLIQILSMCSGTTSNLGILQLQTGEFVKSRVATLMLTVEKE